MPDIPSEFNLEMFLPFRRNRVSEEVSLGFASIYRKRTGMTRPEWRTLANLGQFGRLTSKQICLHSQQHKTKVSRAVAALEKRRWLQRFENPDDRREEWLELTSAGKAVFRELAELGLAYERALIAQLGLHNALALDKGLEALEQLLAKKN